MVFPFKECGACRTCELACSYKKSGDFNPQVAAIEILENTDESGYSVHLIDESDGKRYACDGCLDDEMPMCMQYCHKFQELRKILDAYLEQKSSFNTRGENAP
jgi:Fe-S-cluster-containing hydrogenase component 2